VGYFDVDTKGLAQIVRRRHPGFIFGELISNAFDQPGTTRVMVRYSHVGRGRYSVSVRDDDPTGFSDLRDAYTLFRHTKKRGDAEVRGRFNLGEKEFLSICAEAKITTTIGQVIFKDDKRRVKNGVRTSVGTEVQALIRMPESDFDKAVEFLEMIIPPENITLVINENSVAGRPAVIGDFVSVLPTEIAGEDGELRKSRRKTRVTVSEVPEWRDTPWIFEMGIPICEIPEDKWDINIHQKVPLSRDRDSVTPSYMQGLRVDILNHCHAKISSDDSSEAWVTEAISDGRVDQEAFKAVISSRFGDNAVVYDPSDLEANSRAVAEGRRVIHGASLPKGAHQNNRRFGVVKPAGQVIPTMLAVFSAEGQNIRIPSSDFSQEMKDFVKYATWISDIIVGAHVDVGLVRSEQAFAACYGKRQLLFNVRRLGKAWFSGWKRNITAVNELIIHELAHEYEANHLSDKYHEACCRVGARFVDIVLAHSEKYTGLTSE
jgi:hypothetical protein